VRVVLTRCTFRSIGSLRLAKSPHVTPDTIRNIRAPSIRIAVRIVNNGRQIDAQAILDSGAEGVYCNKAFIEKHNIPTHPLVSPIYARNVDGTLNKQGVIRHAAILRMEMGTRHKETIEAAVTNTGNHDLLLGTDWLQAHNPNIDWTKNKLLLNRCPDTCFTEHRKLEDPTLGHLLPSLEWEEQYDDLLEQQYQGIDVSQHIMAHLRSFFPTVGRTTVSTSLAMNNKQPLQDIPQTFQRYEKVFSDEEAQ